MDTDYSVFATIKSCPKFLLKPIKDGSYAGRFTLAQLMFYDPRELESIQNLPLDPSDKVSFSRQSLINGYIEWLFANKDKKKPRLHCSVCSKNIANRMIFSVFGKYLDVDQPPVYCCKSCLSQLRRPQTKVLYPNVSQLHILFYENQTRDALDFFRINLLVITNMASHCHHGLISRTSAHDFFMES